MKNSLLFSIFVLCLTIIIYFNAQAQWQPDLRLTNNSANSYTSYNNAWCVASSENVVHVVWSDLRDGRYEVYYKRSTNSGVNWGIDTRLTNSPGDSWDPSITVSGQVVHVVWYDFRDGNYEIYYKHSTDAGVSWGADKRLTNNSADSYVPSASVSDATVHIVWFDERDGNKEIYYKRSTDSGVNWGSDTRLTNNSASSESPSVTCSGSVVHVVWQDNRDGNWEIYYKRSTNSGVTWSSDTRLTNNSSASNSPSIAVSGSVVHVVWEDNRDGNDEIYSKRTTDGGVSWGADTRLTNNNANSWTPSIAALALCVHVVWEDHRDGNREIYYKRTTDGGISWEADTRLTNNSSISNYPFVAVSGQVVHVVWEDQRDGNWEIYYKHNPTGSIVEIKNINSEIPSSFSLSQNYPNPFNPTTTIRFDIKMSSDVKLIVYNIEGKEIATLVNEKLNAGSYEVNWNGSGYPSGVYFYRLLTNDFNETKSMLLIK